MKSFQYLVLVLLSLFSLNAIWNLTQVSETSVVAEKVELIENAKNSSNPTVIKAGNDAEKDLIAIQKTKEKKDADKAAYDKLQPYERPATWIMIFILLASIIAMPILFTKAKRNGLA